jgi:Rha family phage regulatory protein
MLRIRTPLTMNSKQIAELCDKRHSHVLRDIKNMFNDLGNEPSFGLDEYIDAKGEKRPMYVLDEAETLCLVSGYNVQLRMKIINQWQQMKDALEVIKYRKNDTHAQIEAMAIIGHMLPPEERKEKLPYIKANSVVNKITCDLHGFPKLIKKDQMNLPMLECRSDLLINMLSCLTWDLIII